MSKVYGHECAPESAGDTRKQETHQETKINARVQYVGPRNVGRIHPQPGPVKPIYLKGVVSWEEEQIDADPCSEDKWPTIGLNGEQGY